MLEEDIIRLRAKASEECSTYIRRINMLNDTEFNELTKRFALKFQSFFNNEEYFDWPTSLHVFERSTDGKFHENIFEATAASREERYRLFVGLGGLLVERNILPLATFVPAEIWLSPPYERSLKSSEWEYKTEKFVITGMTPDRRVSIVYFELERSALTEKVNLIEPEFFFHDSDLENQRSDLLDALFNGYFTKLAWDKQQM